MSHHSPEQVAKAFAYAPTILNKLIEAGVENPSFKLYHDASGKVYLGYATRDDTNVTVEQLKLASELLYSLRPYDPICVKCLDGDEDHSHRIGVSFCCGLVTAAENAE